MADVHVPSLLDDEEISVSNLFDDEIEEACAELREENAAQAARIEELEAERDSWKDDDLNGRVAYDTLRAERNTLKVQCEALEAVKKAAQEALKGWPYSHWTQREHALDAALRAAGE